MKNENIHRQFYYEGYVSHPQSKKSFPLKVSYCLNCYLVMCSRIPNCRGSRNFRGIEPSCIEAEQMMTSIFCLLFLKFFILYLDKITINTQQYKTAGSFFLKNNKILIMRRLFFIITKLFRYVCLHFLKNLQCRSNIRITTNLFFGIFFTVWYS